MLWLLRIWNYRFQCRCRDMADISVTQHRARMVNGIKLTCQKCQDVTAVDSCNNESCSFHFWISNLHKQKLFDLSLLSADFCRYCYGQCGFRYPTCQNSNQAAGQCIRFVGKESSIVCPGSRAGLSIPAIPVVHIWKDGESCQK